MAVKNFPETEREFFLDLELVGPWAAAELVIENRERALLGAQALAIRLVRGGWHVPWEQRTTLAL